MMWYYQPGPIFAVTNIMSLTRVSRNTAVKITLLRPRIRRVILRYARATSLNPSTTATTTTTETTSNTHVYIIIIKI